MNKIVLITAICSVLAYFWTRYNLMCQIENLNKQIDLLECYKENYLIMADSLDGIHNSCFKIGTK